MVQWLTDGGWWHMDQSVQRQGKQCVQGLVSLYDADETTGGLCVIPKSHLKFPEVSSRQVNTRMDFTPICKGDEVLKNGGKLVCCKAGDLLVWDSRTVHCNTPASLDLVAAVLKKMHDQDQDQEQDQEQEHEQEQKENRKTEERRTTTKQEEHNELIRLVAYVCMVPRSFASNKIIQARIAAFETNTQTSHWPHHNIRARPMPDGSNSNFDSAPDNVRALIIGSSVGQEMEKRRCSVM